MVKHTERIDEIKTGLRGFQVLQGHQINLLKMDIAQAPSDHLLLSRRNTNLVDIDPHELDMWIPPGCRKQTQTTTATRL